MKRFWTAVFLFACIVVGCLGNLYFVSQTVSECSIPLEQAADAAYRDDLSEAKRLTLSAQQAYQRRERYLSAVISEKLLDEVRLNFARTVESVGAGDAAQFVVELAGLRQAVDDLLRSEIIDQKNIF